MPSRKCVCACVHVFTLHCVTRATRTLLTNLGAANGGAAVWHGGNKIKTRVGRANQGGQNTAKWNFARRQIHLGGERWGAGGNSGAPEARAAAPPVSGKIKEINKNRSARGVKFNPLGDLAEAGSLIGRCRGAVGKVTVGDLSSALVLWGARRRLLLAGGWAKCCVPAGQSGFPPPARRQVDAASVQLNDWPTWRRKKKSRRSRCSIIFICGGKKCRLGRCSRHRLISLAAACVPHLTLVPRPAPYLCPASLIGLSSPGKSNDDCLLDDGRVGRQRWNLRVVGWKNSWVVPYAIATSAQSLHVATPLSFKARRALFRDGQG